jgi:hypothetical protein
VHGFGKVKYIQYKARTVVHPDLLEHHSSSRVATKSHAGRPWAGFLLHLLFRFCFAFHILLTNRMAGCGPNVRNG